MSVPAAALSPHTAQQRYLAIRAATEALCEPLAIEDQVVQSMPDVSPTRWHLAHVTWFFENFLLKPEADYTPVSPVYDYLFNSYYNAVGDQYPRAQRGLITRPTVAEVMDYRAQVDEAMAQRLVAGQFGDRALALLELGLNHEQQHQELMLMDLKHVLFHNPLYPAYRVDIRPPAGPTPALRWLEFSGGERQFGHQGEGFHYDNEAPRHPRLLDDFRLASRPVTNAEYLAFISDGGYDNPLLWLSDGWSQRSTERWEAPLYWVQRDGEWFEFTLRGLEPLAPDAPVVHLSLYEADAYASWADARLPTEFEWEHAAADARMEAGFLEQDLLHPAPARGEGLQQMLGEVWEWTRSAYEPYPGFQPAPGAVGEYNGKFMCNQMVMRGGSCVTPQSHIRTSYRNFFYPHMRWQFGGLRLARGARAGSDAAALR